MQGGGGRSEESTSDNQDWRALSYTFAGVMVGAACFRRLQRHGQGPFGSQKFRRSGRVRAKGRAAPRKMGEQGAADSGGREELRVVRTVDRVSLMLQMEPIGDGGRRRSNPKRCGRGGLCRFAMKSFRPR